MPIKPGYRRASHLAHGWYLRVHRGAEALVILDRSGYAEEATGIRRAMLEHGVALLWLAAEGDKILDAVAGGHRRDAERRRDALREVEWSSIDPAIFDAVIASIDQAGSRDTSTDNLLNFVPRAKGYAEPYVCPLYLSEVARFHPSLESASCYVDIPNKNYLMSSKDTVLQAPFAAARTLEAIHALGAVFEQVTWADELAIITCDYKEVTNDVRRQDGLPPIPWSETEPA
jgi:hypothetical protein